MREQNGIVRLYGGRRHWSKDHTPDGNYPPCIVYARPREFDASRVFKNMDDPKIFEPTFDREEYASQRVSVCAWTKNFNRVYKDLWIYILLGYSPRRLDFSMMVTDLHHDVGWKFWPPQDRWWWELTGAQRGRAIQERYWHTDFPSLPFEIEEVEHGPAYSEEFEKTFDNPYS